MSRLNVAIPQAIGNSVFHEITRDFRALLQTSRQVLGDRHPLTTACLHASQFPSDRMSYRLVWDQFEVLSFMQRCELLQTLRNQARF